jgi:multicomponent Na+:H+ antiporter subunit F
MKTFYLVCIIFLTILALLCLIRAILGPRLADRILAINVLGTLTIAVIALLSLFLGESSVLDICLVYAAISYVAIIVLMKIYVGIFREERAGEKGEAG